MLDIQSFFHLVATYCMYSEEDIQSFVFQTFDKDDSGKIDEDEFLDLARTVNNAEVGGRVGWMGGCCCCCCCRRRRRCC